jgi:hypothetical protein
MQIFKVAAPDAGSGHDLGKFLLFLLCAEFHNFLAALVSAYQDGTSAES